MKICANCLLTKCGGNDIIKISARVDRARGAKQKTGKALSLPIETRQSAFQFIIVEGDEFDVFPFPVIFLILLAEVDALTVRTHARDKRFPLCCGQIGKSVLDERPSLIADVVLFPHRHREKLPAERADNSKFKISVHHSYLPLFLGLFYYLLLLMSSTFYRTFSIILTRSPLASIITLITTCPLLALQASLAVLKFFPLVL